MKKVKKQFKKYSKIAKKRVTIAMLPFFALLSIIGYFAIGFKKTFIIIGVLLICSIIIDFIRNMTGKKSSKKKKKRKKKRNIPRIIFNVFLVSVIIGIVALITFVTYIALTAPKFNPDALYKKESSIIYDAEGKELAKLGLEIRDKVTFDEIPEVLIDAIIATEDSRFYQHNGFDLPRFIKAASGQLRGDNNAGGASTITMQVTKNEITNTKVSVVRKFTDIYMSMFVLERKYSKEQIFEFYVNAPYLGNSSYGIAEAVRNYFGKEVKDINLSEAAFIAGLFQSPSYYGDAVWTKPERIEGRRNTVLYLMKRHGYINEEEEKIAKALTITSLLKQKSSEMNKYQSFIDTVINEIEEKTGNSPYKVAMKVYTTLDTKRQDIINNVVDVTFRWPNEKTQTGIAVTNVHTGALIALSGGRNITVERGFNRATDLKRQPGSIAKPLFDYGPGVEYNNWSTYTQFLDAPHSYSNGSAIKNWDSQYMGLMTLKKAVGLSRNIPALRAFQSVDNKQILNFVTGLGLKPEIEGGYVHEAHSLGAYNGTNPVEMAAAYAAFANGGYYIKPYTVTKIIYTENGDIEEFSPIKNKIMRDSSAYIITNVLKWAVEGGISGGSGYVPGYQTALKTGTSNYDNDFLRRWKLSPYAINDLWSAGYSQDYSMTVWYGYDNITAESAKNGWYSQGNEGGRKEKLYNTIFREIVKGGAKTFNVPKSVVSVTVENGTIPAQLPSEYTPTYMRITEIFSKGTEPTKVSPRYKKLDPPTKLIGEVKDKKINLSWNPVKLPEYYTDEYMIKHFDEYYGSNSASYMQNHQNSITTEMGVMGYDIYYKGDDNIEHYLATTVSNKATVDNPQLDGKTTIVVKTAFSNFKTTASNGTTFEFKNEIVTPKIIYSPTISKASGSPNILLKDLITIMNNGKDVTKDSIIKYVFTKAPPLSSDFPITTTSHAIYTIEYTISYKGVDVKSSDGKNIVQTITIE